MIGSAVPLHVCMAPILDSPRGPSSATRVREDHRGRSSDHAEGRGRGEGRAGRRGVEPRRPPIVWVPSGGLPYDRWSSSRQPGSGRDRPRARLGGPLRDRPPGLGLPASGPPPPVQCRLRADRCPRCLTTWTLPAWVGIYRLTDLGAGPLNRSRRPSSWASVQPHPGSRARVMAPRQRWPEAPRELRDEVVDLGQPPAERGSLGVQPVERGGWSRRRGLPPAGDATLRRADALRRAPRGGGPAHRAETASWRRSYGTRRDVRSGALWSRPARAGRARWRASAASGGSWRPPPPPRGPARRPG